MISKSAPEGRKNGLTIAAWRAIRAEKSSRTVLACVLSPCAPPGLRYLWGTVFLGLKSQAKFRRRFAAEETDGRMDLFFSQQRLGYGDQPRAGQGTAPPWVLIAVTVD